MASIRQQKQELRKKIHRFLYVLYDKFENEDTDLARGMFHGCVTFYSRTLTHKQLQEWWAFLKRKYPEDTNDDGDPEPCGRFMLFLHSKYGSAGGLNDIAKITDNFEQAIALGEKEIAEKSYEIAYIFDRIVGLIVWEKFGDVPEFGPTTVTKDGSTIAAPREGEKLGMPIMEKEK